jgi:long-chain acyl-CoA synthetase
MKEQRGPEALPGLDQLASAALNGDPTAQAIEFEGCWHTWADLADVANTVIDLVTQAGLDPRAPIGFVPRNRPSAVAAELGLIAARRTIRMIYAFQSPAGIARDVARLKVGAVVAAREDFTPDLLAVVRQQGLAAIALTDGGASVINGAHRSAAALDDDAPTVPQIQIHTSGTTGPPKNIGFAYDMIERFIVGQNLSAVGAAAQDPTPVLLSFPLGNISGVYGTLVTMLSRRPAVLLDRFSLDAWRDFVRRYRPAMPMLPPAGVGMVLEANVPPEELACIKMIMTGAAPLDPGVQRAFEERYGIPILIAYGATEFGGPVTAMTPELHAEFGARKIGTVGRPFADARLRVIDPDTHVVLPAGSEGLLEVMAPRMGPHWIRTTDIGIIDEDGFVFLRGRADGAIVRGGFKLLPEAIERALSLHPAVAAVSVVGLRDSRLGHVPAAAIQFKRGAQHPEIAELEQHLRQHVYATHIPARWLVVESLPRNSSVKVDLPAVRALFES